MFCALSSKEVWWNMCYCQCDIYYQWMFHVRQHRPSLEFLFILSHKACFDPLHLLNDTLTYNHKIYDLFQTQKTYGIFSYNVLMFISNSLSKLIRASPESDCQGKIHILSPCLMNKGLLVPGVLHLYSAMSSGLSWCFFFWALLLLLRLLTSC